MYAEYGIAHGTEGKFAKQTVGTNETWADLSSAALVDGASYELGYYKVTMPTTSAEVQGVTFTVKDSAQETYLKKGETFELTITTSGTGSGISAAIKDFTVTGGSMENGTVTATTGTVGTAAVSGGNKLTVTVPQSGAADTVFTVSVTVTGADNVTFA